MASSVMKAGSNGSRVLDLEKKLKQLGYLKGPADSRWDARTAEAVAKYKKAQGWKTTAVAGDRVGRKLGLEGTFTTKRREKLTITTMNDDFTDKVTDVKKAKADVVLLQETKNNRLRKALPDSDRFGVHQGTAADKANASIVWKKGAARATDRGYALGVEPRGAAMLKRWISWVDMDVGGTKVRMVSVHRPPKRFDHLWSAFDRNLAAFVKSSKLPVVIGMDANQVNPARMARLTGLKWHAPPGSIDGFLATPGIRFNNLRRLPKHRSDHHPVTADISIPVK